ncbi:MAG: carbohydrate-binding family 9-like protein [Acidobacteria bacterium]|nr:carbohydrate-binding family 9-like protein [Acidobacteriota bacterium]
MSCVNALQLDVPLNEAGLPDPASWQKAVPIIFCSDWRGENTDDLRETEVRMLWSYKFLFIRFRCRYREIYAYKGGNSRRDKLWMRDVAEIFIRPPGRRLRHYLEFEISPNGYWLDLDIAPNRKTILFCDLKSRAAIDPDASVWTAELAIPMNCLTAFFNPDDSWRVNLFRIEGSEPNRFYSAWHPTHTSQPNFHVPEAFGELHFLKAPSSRQ